MRANLPLPANRTTVLAYIRKHLGPRWLNLLLIFMKNVIGSLLYMVPPLMSKYVLESVLPARDWNWLVLVAICMVAAPITGSAMIIAEDYFGRFMIRLSGQGRAELYDGLQRRPLAELRRRRAGDLITRILDDTRSIGDLANGNIGFMCFHVVTIAVGSALLLYLHPGLAAVVLLLWAGQAALMTVLGGRVKRRSAETARHNSQVAETVREIVSAAAFLKAAGQEARALGTMRDCLRREWSHTRLGTLTEHRIQIANAALNGSFLVVMYAIGGSFVLRGHMTVGSLVAFVAVYNWLRPFGVSLIGMAMAAMKVLPAIDRVADIAYPAGGEGGTAVPEGPAVLEADRLSFRYAESESGRLSLHDVSFRIAPGSVVSIVGHRGSGKSTLADLLLGLREPSSGIVSLGGIPFPLIDPAWLRRHMLCVTQDVMLRSGTILDNLVYGSEEADLESVREAVRRAELEEWISRLPEGWFTRVGEQGLQLSGGERQRISIARALLRKPSILILDEATSALDMGTEHRLLRSLTASLKGCTLIFITHRLSIAKRSDHILVMHDGVIAESGTYEELVAGPTLFRSFCEHAADGASHRSGHFR
ncbi:ABC transporter ATP-binding protein [Paenibacillus mesophilus]|uniref:ABC transporter ATP-binding protein n=1 Tax=Paenibacillus mesophilus TaxID=2582849 RepID=UPI001305220D|nr:ABC transporter ATP-binding protein [Paenibacillus mesophilus]